MRAMGQPLELDGCELICFQLETWQISLGSKNVYVRIIIFYDVLLRRIPALNVTLNIRYSAMKA